MSVLDQTKQDLMQQRAAVNLAFEKRIREISTAKEALEKHFHKVGRLLYIHSCYSVFY